VTKRVKNLEMDVKKLKDKQWLQLQVTLGRRWPDS
jgi:hypothetical protein